MVSLRLPDPDESGVVDVAGVRIAWDSFGRGESAVLVIPTWNFVDSRVSASLIRDLSPMFRVVTFDPRGAGRSDRPRSGYRIEDHLADAIGVIADANLARVSLVAASSGANVGVLLAARLPDRVERLVLVGSAIEVAADATAEDAEDDTGFWIERPSYEGWERWSAAYWRQDWEAFARWFLGEAFPEPDSADVIDAVLAIALEADPEILIEQQREQDRERSTLNISAVLAHISSPTLIVHGALDRSVPLAVAAELATAIPDAVLAVATDGGHRPDIRSPRLIDPLVREFLLSRRLRTRPGIKIRSRHARAVSR
jgi:pimeloyl-ACP methyl ester carboxylesterase